MFILEALPDGQNESRCPFIDVVDVGGTCCCTYRRGLELVLNTYSRVALGLDVLRVDHRHLALGTSTTGLRHRLHLFAWMVAWQCNGGNPCIYMQVGV